MSILDDLVNGINSLAAGGGLCPPVCDVNSGLSSMMARFGSLLGPRSDQGTLANGNRSDYSGAFPAGRRRPQASRNMKMDDGTAPLRPNFTSKLSDY